MSKIKEVKRLFSWQSFGLVIIIYSYYLRFIIGELLGNHVSQIFILYPLIFGAFVFLKNGIRFSIHGLPVISLYLVFFVFMVVGVFFADDYSYSSFIYIGRYGYSAIFLGFITLAIISRSGFDIDLFLFYFLIFSALMVVYSALTGGEYQGRLTVSGSNPIYFSLLCAMACCVAFVNVVERVDLKNKIMFSILFFVVFYGLISSGGRGALLSFIVVIGGYIMCRALVLLLNNRFPVALFLFFSFLFLLFIFFGDFFSNSSARSFRGLYKLLSGEVDVSGGMRLESIRVWLDYFYSSPILGVGVGSLDGYPHNIFIELIVLSGISGFVFFVLFSIIIVFCFFQAQFANSTSIKALSLIVLCAFLNSMFSFSFNMLSHLFILTVILFVLCRREKTHRGGHV